MGKEEERRSGEERKESRAKRERRVEKGNWRITKEESFPILTNLFFE